MGSGSSIPYSQSFIWINKVSRKTLPVSVLVLMDVALKSELTDRDPIALIKSRKVADWHNHFQSYIIIRISFKISSKQEVLCY